MTNCNMYAQLFYSLFDQGCVFKPIRTLQPINYNTQLKNATLKANISVYVSTGNIFQ